MKPRLYLYGGAGEFKGSLFVDLDDLLPIVVEVNLHKYYIHVGFKPLDTDSVKEKLELLPNGFFCSRTFKESDPGDNWEFSKPLDLGLEELDTFFIVNAPLQNYITFEGQWDEISALEFREKANDNNLSGSNFLLSDHMFSVRTSNVLANNNIVYLSDLTVFTETELLNLENFGHTSLSELREFLQERGLYFGMPLDVFHQRILSNHNKSGKTPPKQDELLSHHNFSVRTKNVLVSNNIVYLSDLTSHTEASLLRMQNFGRKSLKELKEFLRERDLHLGSKQTLVAHNPDLDPGFKKIELTELGADISARFEEIENERQRYFLFKRSGLHGKSTLEELGQIENVTRERIRQIERKGLNDIFKSQNNVFKLWYLEICRLVLVSSYPLPLKDLGLIDSRLEGGKNIQDCIKYILYWVNYFEDKDNDNFINLVDFKQTTYVTPNSEEEIKIIEKLVIEALNRQSKVLVESIRLETVGLITEKQMPFFNHIWLTQLQNCLIKQDENEQDVLVKYVKRSAAELGVQILLEAVETSDVPLTKSALEAILEQENLGVSSLSIMNAFQKNEDVFAYSHGTWGSLKHATFNQDDVAIILREAATLLASPFIKKTGSSQFHTRDLRSLLEKKISGDLTYFEIAGILRKFGNLSYLGRSVFAENNSETAGRIFLHDVFIKILRAHGKPLHATELINEAREYVSISEAYQPHPTPPLINLGQNTWALDYWPINKLSITDKVRV